MTQHPIQIAFCVDNRFCLPLGVLIQSLKEQTRRPLSLHIVAADLESQHRKSLESYNSNQVNVTFYDINDRRLSNLRIDKGFSERLSVATYYRFLLPDLLPQKVDKLLFLDADMLCMEPVESLYDLPLEGAISLVVPDAKLTESQRWDALNLAKSHYFNAGMMLMDLAKWRSLEITAKCFELIARNKEWEYNDQDVLNIVLNQHVTMIDKKWNCQSHGFLPETGFEPGIVHFTGAEKPWQVSCIHPFTAGFRATLGRSAYHHSSLQHYLDSHDKKAITRVLSLRSSNRSVIIYGCGQRGRRLFSYLRDNYPEIPITGFIDRSPPECDLGVPVYSQWPGDPEQSIFIGSEAFREEIIASLLQQGALKCQII